MNQDEGLQDGIKDADLDRSPKKGRKDILIIVVVSVVLLAAMYGWRELSLSAAQDEFARVQAEFKAKTDAEKEKMRADAVASSEKSRTEALKLMAMPLGWAVRKEMMSGNMEQVDEYVADLVRVKGVGKAALADSAGSIIAASDRKLVDQPLSNAFPAEIADAQGIVIQAAGPDSYNVGVPVMGLTDRLGVFAFTYEFDH